MAHELPAVSASIVQLSCSPFPSCPFSHSWHPFRARKSYESLGKLPEDGYATVRSGPYLSTSFSLVALSVVIESSCGSFLSLSCSPNVIRRLLCILPLYSLLWAKCILFKSERNLHNFLNETFLFFFQVEPAKGSGLLYMYVFLFYYRHFAREVQIVCVSQYQLWQRRTIHRHKNPAGKIWYFKNWSLLYVFRYVSSDIVASCTLLNTEQTTAPCYTNLFFFNEQDSKNRGCSKPLFSYQCWKSLDETGT